MIWLAAQEKLPASNNDIVAFQLVHIIRWYFQTVYGRVEGPNSLPFYLNPELVGAFAVSKVDLALGEDSATFRLFVLLAMFQARRDVVIMQQQRSLEPKTVNMLSDLSFFQQSVAQHPCAAMGSAKTWDLGCNVFKAGKVADCLRHPGSLCHVKDATTAFNRMGDMGKLPTSAYLHFWKDGGIRNLLAEITDNEASPNRRADLLVLKLSKSYRIGRKLATMFVSALSVPDLAEGYTPWFPEFDGSELVVVDTNVARAVKKLQETDTSQTYEASTSWVHTLAELIDLRQFHPNVPEFSPRLVQQALYAFCSKSNRLAQHDPCSKLRGDCSACAQVLCPIA